MARTGWSTSNFLRTGSAVVSAMPLTIAAWARTTLAGTTQHIAGVYNSGAAAGRQHFALTVSSSNRVEARCASGSGSGGGESSADIPASTWFHAAAVFTSNTNRAAYLNGGNKGTGTEDRTPSGLNRTSMGVEDGSSAGNAVPSGAAIAEVGIWNIALTDEDIAALATGISPLLIHPEALVGYWPVLGVRNPEANLFLESTAVSVQGSLSAFDHPPIIRPRRRSAA